MSKAQDQKQRGGRRDLAWAAALAAWLVLLIVPAAASASDVFSGDLTGGATDPLGSPTIRSDKADYAPGETVVLTGDNWLPGERVHVRVNDNVGQSWVRDSDVNADASGSIRDEFQLPTSFIAEYAVTATGDASGAAQTTFTDGNVKITANFNAQVTETPYKAPGCTGETQNNFPKTETASSSPTGNTAGVGVGNTESVRLDAAANPNSPNEAAVFDRWEAVTPGATFTTIAGTGGRGICVEGFSGDGTREYRIIYTAANAAPTVTRDNASRTVNEGQTATNTGTWADANAGDTVTLSASVGTVTKNANGTWSWSYATTDGPAQSQTVTITATDNHGASSSVTFALTVQNVAPVVTATTDQTADEGASKSFAMGSFTDPGADGPWAVTVDWGDGSAATTFSEASPGTISAKSHTYADDGEYTVSVKVAEAGTGTTPSDTKTFKVTVANVAPAVTAAADQTASEGTTKSFSLGSFTDPGTDGPWAVTVNWGDSSTPTTFTEASPGTITSQSHTYADNGQYTVTVTVTEAGSGSPPSDGKTFKVTVANVAPTAIFTNNGPVDEGLSFKLSLTGADDVSAADKTAGFTYAFDCGDGTGYSSFGATPERSCPTSDDGTRNVKAKIKDKDGDEGEYTDTVTVRNVAPEVTAADDQTAVEGTSKSFELGSFTDPGDDGPWQVTVDWGDGSAATTFTAASPGALSAKPHTYADNGDYTVTVKVAEAGDGDTPSDSKTFKVSVANVAPTAKFENNGPVNEGDSFKLFLNEADDVSSADKAAGFQYAFDCGDGSGYGTYGSSADRTCPTADDGTRNVKGKIKDKDGGETEYTDQVTVNNVAPVVTTAADQSATEGTSNSFDLGSFTDPGADGPWGVSVSWGDGSDPTTFTAASPGGIASQGHTYADNGAYTVTVKVAEAGSGVTPTDTKTFKVNVANVAPTATFGNDGPVDEGQSFKLSLEDAYDASAVDKAAGFQYAFDCGDGSGYGAYSDSAERSCSTNDNGSRGVKSKIKDKDGGEREYTASVQVDNVAPTATLGNDGPVDEGQSFKLSLTGADDVSSADKAAGFTYAFDCGSGYGAYGTSSEQSCPTADNGTRGVKGKLKDKDGGEREYTATVTVKNVGPVITSFNGTNYLTGPLAYIGGGPSQSTFDTKFTDPGADSPWTALFTYSDGTPNPESFQRPNTDLFSVKHAFNGAGCAKSATVKVTDKDGAYDSKTTTVDVGTGAFLPPLANQPVADKLRDGQVLPVKIHVSDCSGAAITNLAPAIRLVKGDKTPPPENTTDLIEPQSVSSADTSGVMRSIGGGDYLYNMRVDVPKADLGAPYTIVIYPYGLTSGQQLGHVVLAVK